MEKRDRELLALIRKNPEEGLCRMIDEYGAVMKTICRHILRDCGQNLTEDAVQESIIHLWKNIQMGVKIRKNFKGYLCQTTRNCALDYLRKYKGHACLSMDSPECEVIEGLVLNLSANVEDEFARKHNFSLVHEAVREMDEPNRTIFLLRYFYSYSVREIAEKMQMKEDNVESRIRRGKKALQQKLVERGILYDTGKWEKN